MKWNFCVIVLILCLTLISCGGGGGEEQRPSGPPLIDPPAPLPVSTDNLEGNWFTIYEENQCIEIFRFEENGRFTIESNEAVLSGDYTLSAEQDNRQELSLRFTQQVDGIDCENSYEPVVGVTLSLFVVFPDDESLNLFESVNSTPALLSLTLDNPISFVQPISNLDYDQLLQLQVVAERESTESIVLVNAPSNAQIDEQGLITWQPNMPMLDKTTEVTFTVGFAHSIQDIQALVDVTDTNRSLPTVRTETRSFNNRRVIEKMVAKGNFDNHPGEELVLVNSGISHYAQNEGALEWKWTYPYHIPFEFSLNISRPTLQVFDAQNDGVDNLYIGILSQIFMLDGVDSKAELVYESDNHFYAFTTHDLNADSVPEFVMIKLSDEGYYIEVFDTVSETILYTSEAIRIENQLSEEFFPPRIANVDEDPALEIVWSSGQVIDAQTGETKWYFPEAFGTHVVLQDLDEDGINEIVGHGVTVNSFGTPKVWSGQTQQEIASEDDNGAYICSISSGISNNSVYFNFCDENSLIKYTLNDSTLMVEESINLFEFNTSSVFVDDIDNDDSDEFLFIGSSAGLTLLNSSDDAGYEAKSYPSLKTFNTLGFASIRPEEVKPVFISEINGSFEHAISSIDLDGQITSSEPMFDLEFFAQGALGDAGDDGFNDILLAVESPDQLQYQEIQSGVRGQSVSYPFSNFYSGYQIKLLDVNNDGIDEALIANEDAFVILEIASNTILTSQDMPSEPFFVSDYDFVFKINQQNDILIALSSFSGTRLFRYENEALILLAQIDLQCNNLAFLPQSGNLFCVNNETFDSLFHVYDNNLNLLSSIKESSFNQEKEYGGFVIIPDSDNVYASLYAEGETGRYVNSIVELNPYTMNDIWVSPPVMGGVTQGNIHLRDDGSENPSLFFTSAVSIYWTH